MILPRWVLALLATLTIVSVGCDSSAPAAATSAVEKPTAKDTEIESVSTKPNQDPPEENQASKSIIDSSFDDIKFEMEKTEEFERSMLTPKVENLFDKKIRIRGYMFPTLKKRGLKQFVLVRDNLECCFGPGAALFDCILINMNEGKSAEYSIRPIAVEGVFRFSEMIGPDGKHLAIYSLDADSAE